MTSKVRSLRVVRSIARPMLSIVVTSKEVMSISSKCVDCVAIAFFKKLSSVAYGVSVRTKSWNVGSLSCVLEGLT